MGLTTVAEGVEYDSQLRPLVLGGCGYRQGLLFARPLSEEAASVLVRNGFGQPSDAGVRPWMGTPTTGTVVQAGRA
jgi:predicted signal transduction protein with EAL and GGDEF domain